LACVRSLGRAGLRVAVGESVGQLNMLELADAPTPSFRSRYCQGTLILPDLIADTPGFIAALTEFVTEHSPRVILPSGDVTIGVLRPYRQHFANLGCIVALGSSRARTRSRPCWPRRRPGALEPPGGSRASLVGRSCPGSSQPGSFVEGHAGVPPHTGGHVQHEPQAQVRCVTIVPKFCSFAALILISC
jgi:hypothetical protein